MADLPDPSTLSDEELDKLLNGEQPEEEPEDTPPAGEEPETEEPEAPEAEEPESPEEPEPPVEEDPKPPTRREQLRLQQLLDKYREQPAAPKPTTVTPQGLNYEDELDAPAELIKRLQEDRQTASEQAYASGLEQAKAIEWRTLLHIDSPAVQATHAQLNPKDKEHFHPAVNNAINTFYLTMSGYDDATQMPKNPGIRYQEFVDSVFELAEEIASTKVVEARKAVASQVSKTGLRPNGTQAKRLNLNKEPEDMTDEELNAYLAKQGFPVK